MNSLLRDFDGEARFGEFLPPRCRLLFKPAFALRGYFALIYALLKQFSTRLAPPGEFRIICMEGGITALIMGRKGHRYHRPLSVFIMQTDFISGSLMNIPYMVLNGQFQPSLTLPEGGG